jgi:phospho-N-acetylmuramoyl-pentapeptide-transferase
MLYHLFMELRHDIDTFRFFQYTTVRILAAVITAMIISFLLYPWLIRQLRRLRIGQVIREEMDESHQAKGETPTMGGSLLLFAIVVPTVLWADLTNPYIWMALAVTFGFSMVGFIDDMRKIRKRDSKGLSGRAKLILQFAIGIGVMAMLFATSEFDSTLYFPFVDPDRASLDLGVWLYIAFGAFVVVGTSNSVNLTDGLDGLAIGPCIIASGTFLILAYAASAELGFPAVTEAGQEVTAYVNVAEYLNLAQVPGAQELTIFAGSVVGAGVGFLWFNTYPAQIFMGDIGSLSVGGAIGVLAVATKNEILSIFICGIFVIEAVSVIIQRYYYKATKKRVFLMAPIHHHFEKKNWSESQIVVRFWIIAIMLSLFSLISLKLR